MKQTAILVLCLVAAVTACSRNPDVTPDAPLAPTHTPGEPEFMETPTPTTSRPSDPLAGLVYSTLEGLWIIDYEGQAQFLLDQPDGVLSPDGSQVVYESDYCPDSDLWIYDVQTGEHRNLTNTPERSEHMPQWWSARDSVIVFLSTRVGGECFGYGYPGTVNLNGSEYRILDESKGGPFALSPDGETIAFGCCDGPGVLYHWSEGAKIFDPLDYGANIPKLFKPVWSPDGRQLAWDVGGEMFPDQGWQVSIAVFDLEAREVRYLHTYTPIGGSEKISQLAWSPDGNWLAYVTQAEVQEAGRNLTLWVVRADGLEEHYLGFGSGPVWSPDGQTLAFTRVADTTPPEYSIWLAHSDDWESPQQLFAGTVEGWIEK
ncbi:MAG: hypothetical protein GTO14_02650 [Anaerolineales bacterium]|nr:hypothetical protein [Anaerolineales bacterium]